MNECPHCGEPLREGAESCPYCGSDAETGWNPDADYLGLELPDDDFDLHDSRRAPLPELNWEGVLGVLLVLLAVAAFLWAGYRVHAALVVPFALLLGLCYLLYCRWLQSRA
jgi:hypothetical protein